MSSTAVLPIVSQNFLALSPGYTTVTPSSANSSVSRAGNATLFDSTGKLTYAPNNLCLQSANTFSTSPWTVAANASVSGGVTISNTANFNGVSQAIGVMPAGSPCIFSIDVLKTSGATTFPGFSIQRGSYNSVALNTDTGIATARSTEVPAAFSVSDNGSYWRVCIKSDTPSATGGTIYIYPCVNSNASATWTGGNGSVTVRNAQVEAVTYQTTPSTYVATTSSAYYGPRYDYNPATLASKGLLVEAAATNLVLQSNGFDGSTVWPTIAGSLVANSVASPDGTTNASLFTPTAGSAAHLIYLNSPTYAPSYVAGTTYSISVHVKVSQGTSRYIQIGTGSTRFGANNFANFDLVSGVVGSVGASALSATIKPLASGWYRLTIVAVCTVSGSDNMYISLAGSSSDTRQQAYTAVVTDTFAPYGTQIEAGSFATSYIPTTSASVTRAAETYTPTAYTSQLVMATYTDEQTGSTYYVNLNPGNTWAGNGWITSLRAYDGTTAAVPTWLDVSATTGNRMITDSTGKLTYAPANILVRSQDFANASWNKTRSSIDTTPQTAPDGSSTATKLVEDTTASNNHFTFQTIATLAGVNYITSIYVKPAGRTWISIGYDFQARTYFDVQNGVPGTVASGFTASIQSAGNGWFRCSVIGPPGATTSLKLFIASGNGTDSYTGDGTSGIYLWGAQLEAVTYQTLPSTYNATTTAAYYGPRFDYDPSTLAAKGLLIEESRANIALQSNTFNTTWGIISIAAFGSGSVLNATTSPDGNTNAAQLTAAAATASHYMSQNITWTAAIYTVSFYVKRNTQQYVQITTWDGTVTRHMNFDILNGTVGTGSNSTGSITNIGNGWYRVSMTTSAAQAAAAGNTTLAFSNSSSASSNPNYATTGTESFFVYGCQIEAGSFATSYIPTVAASVTRAADVIKLSGAALTTLQGASGAVIVETNGATYANNNIGGILGFNSGSQLPIYAFGQNSIRTYNGTTPLTANGTITPTENLRGAVSWSATGRSITFNGNNVASDGSQFASSITSSRLADASATGGVSINNHFRSIALYNQRLPDATLKSKSVVNAPL